MLHSIYRITLNLLIICNQLFFGMPKILLLFSNKFMKLNNTGEGMLDSILSYDIKFTNNM